MEKLSAFEYGLLKLSVEELLDVVADFAKQEHDGHFAILSFTTGYKVAFGTPDLDGGHGRDDVLNLKGCENIKDAMIHAILYQSDFY